MSYDPFQALYSGTGGVLLLLLTTIESTYPTVCVCCVLEIWNDDFHEGFHDPSQFTLHVRKKKSQQAAPKQRPVEQL